MSQSPYTPPPLESIQPERYSIPGIDAYGNPLPELLLEPRKCSAGWGLSWLTNAFSLFKQNPLMWIGMVLAFFGIVMVLSFIPLLNIVASFLGFIFIGGIIQGCAAQAQGDELKFDHLFVGFKTHLQPLIVMSLLYLAGLLVALIPMFFVMGGMMMVMLSGDISQIDSISNASVVGILLAYLVSFALMIPIFMMVWFAPSLIVLHDLSALEAMKKSFKGCLKNMLPMLIYSLILIFVMPFVIILTLGLGLLVAMPLIMITYYTSYRDVWTTQPLSS